MPCSDGRYIEELYQKEKNDKLKKLLDESTDAACQAFKLLEAAGLSGAIKGAAKDWWKEHKYLDEMRLKNE